MGVNPGPRCCSGPHTIKHADRCYIGDRILRFSSLHANQQRPTNKLVHSGTTVWHTTFPPGLQQAFEGNSHPGCSSVQVTLWGARSMLHTVKKRRRVGWSARECSVGRTDREHLPPITVQELLGAASCRVSDSRHQEHMPLRNTTTSSSQTDLSDLFTMLSADLLARSAAARGANQ